MTHEELVHECSYRGAELVIERQRNALFEQQLRRRLEAEWTDFLDANPDDLTSPEELPDHALVTFEQMANMVEVALAAGTQGAETNEDLAQSEGCQSGPQGNAQ